jgi:hypothetical protein
MRKLLSSLEIRRLRFPQVSFTARSHSFSVILEKLRMLARTSSLSLERCGLWSPSTYWQKCAQVRYHGRRRPALYRFYRVCPSRHQIWNGYWTEDMGIQERASPFLPSANSMEAEESFGKHKLALQTGRRAKRTGTDMGHPRRLHLYKPLQTSRGDRGSDRAVSIACRWIQRPR